MKKEESKTFSPGNGVSKTKSLERLEPLFSKSQPQLHLNSFQSRCLQSYNALLNKLEGQSEAKEATFGLCGSKTLPSPIINLPPAPRLQSLSNSPKESKTLDRMVLEPKVPLVPKDSDLEQDCITKIPIRKKDCRISDMSGNLIPYMKFRENIEHIIFYDPENSGLFFGYSKLQLFEEFQRCNSKLYFTLKFDEPNGLKQSSETFEFYIPMSQIARVLEYSHPVYQIVKASFSMHLYQLIAIELEK